MERRIFLEPLNLYTNTAFASYPLDSSATTEIRLEQDGEPVKVWESTQKELDRMMQFASETPELQFNVYSQTDKSHFPRRLKSRKKVMKEVLVTVTLGNRKHTLKSLREKTAKVLARRHQVH